MLRFPHCFVTIFLLGAVAWLVMPMGRAEKPEPPAAKPPAPGMVRLTPKPFFDGPTERLGKHIGWDTACYAVEYAGDPLPVKLEMVEWQAGKASAPKVWAYDTIKANGEASLVIRELEDAREKREPGERIYLHSSSICGGGRASGRHKMPVLKSEKEGHGGMSMLFANQDKPVELTKGRPVALCAVMAGNGIERQSSDETFEEKAKRVEWAAVMWLSVTDKD